MKHTKKQIEVLGLLNGGHLMDEEVNENGTTSYQINNKKYLNRTISPLIEQGVIVNAFYNCDNRHFTTAIKEKESFIELSNYFVGGITEPDENLRYTYQEIYKAYTELDEHVTGYVVFERLNAYSIQRSNKTPEIRKYHTTIHSYFEDGSKHKSNGYKRLFKTRKAALKAWRYEQSVIYAKKLRALDKAILKCTPVN